MPVVTDTTDYEISSSPSVRLATDGRRCAGMTDGASHRLFSKESSMSVATDTTKHEKDDGLSVAARLIAGAGNWIPAFAGMTIAVSSGLFSG